MKEPSSSRTLVIDRPCGQVIISAVLLAVITWGLVEGLLRLAVGAGRLPAPRIGSVNAELDTKLLLLDKYITNRGRVDCFFLGSSQFDEAVDPEVFESVFSGISGRQLNCFNFSLGTNTASGDGRIARMLVKKYHPRIMFIGLSARDFSDDFGELTRPLLEDPWVRYSLGEFTLSGWLTEHSLVYRELLTIRSSLNPDYMALFDRLSYQLTETGYLLLTGTDLSNPKKNFIPKFSLSVEDMAGLDEMIALDSPETQMVFVEVPVHPSFLPFYVQADEGAYYTMFQSPIADYLAKTGEEFWLTQNSIGDLIADTGWTDVKHLNRDGSAAFSSWLAKRTSEALSTGQIRLPAE